MPPRYAYWTIIAGGLPTAFRATERDELLPTYQRIKEKHPDAVMKWFARGKLWDTPEAARVRPDDGRGRDRGRTSGGPGVKPQPRQEHGRPPAPPRPGAVEERRTRDWRPGGEHRDPRQKFIDAKKQKNAALRKDRWDRKNAPPHGKPHGDPLRGETTKDLRPAGRDHWRDRKPGSHTARSDRPRQDRSARPGQDRPRDPRGPQTADRFRERPHGDPLRTPTRPDPRRNPPRDQWRDRPREDTRPPRAPADRGGRDTQGRTEWKPKGRPDWKSTPNLRSRGDEGQKQPPRPRGPNREPRRSETPPPTPPPRPNEPAFPPRGPAEQGRKPVQRPFKPRGTHPRGPRR